MEDGLYEGEERRERADAIGYRDDPLAFLDRLPPDLLLEYAKDRSRDELTGLLTRDAFETVARFVDDSLYPMALYVVDLVDLHGINTRLGRERGSEAIRAAAESLEQSVRPSNLAVRLGGDEIGVLVPPGIVDLIAPRMEAYLEEYEISFPEKLEVRHAYVTVATPAEIPIAVSQAIDKSYREIEQGRASTER